MKSALKLFPLTLLATLLLCGACLAEDDKMSPKLEVLQIRCQELTEETGKKYELISGTFIASEHEVLDIGGSWWAGFQMPVDTLDRGLVTGSFAYPISKMDKLYEELFQIFGETSIRKKIDKNERYAFCGNRNIRFPNEYLYTGKFNTITKLEK